MKVDEAQAICDEVDKKVLELNALLNKAFDEKALKFYVAVNANERFPLDVITAIVPIHLDRT